MNFGGPSAVNMVSIVNEHMKNERSQPGRFSMNDDEQGSSL
jgi:hypothetical protein